MSLQRTRSLTVMTWSAGTAHATLSNRRHGPSVSEIEKLQLALLSMTDFKTVNSG